MSGNPPAAASAAPEVGGDWRKSVLQSYRNSEVREISKVLAALEGSAITPSSKLMLAMRFEDQIFKSAKDLADYRKKISKRLKKLQKNYVRPAVSPVPPSDTKTAPGDNTEAKTELMAKLKREYGTQLAYIVKNAKAAVEDLEKKLGTEKALQLQQHTDSCRLWARDLGILSKEQLDAIAPSGKESTTTKEEKSEETKTTTTTTTTTANETKEEQKSPTMSNIAAPLSFAQLQRIEKHLQTRIGNIRSYVVKHADPDQFLLETLQSKDVQFSKNTMGGNLLKDAIKARNLTQREMYEKASAGDNNKAGTASEAAGATPSMKEEEPLLVLQKALEKALAGVPPPTRNDSMKLEGSLRHLDKMRAASLAMMNYWLLDGDKRVATAPRDTLKKIHEVVQEGTDFVLDAVKELEQQKKIRRYNTSTGASNDDGDSKAPNVSLQDAWSKTIELPSAAAPMDDDDANNTTTKRPRTNSYKPYYRTRMLFRPNRKTPQPLLTAIRRKGAKLLKIDCGNTNAAHLILDFDDAFTMTIYLSPLTVTLRAKPKHGEADAGNDTSGSSTEWKALSHGLTPWGSTLDSSDFLRRKAATAQNISNNTDEQQLSVWGVTSDYGSIGRVVEERLRDASTHATAILRKCFKNHVKDKTRDFEVELLEGSALLEFLQLARSTYMPNWEDKDV